MGYEEGHFNKKNQKLNETKNKTKNHYVQTINLLWLQQISPLIQMKMLYPYMRTT